MYENKQEVFKKRLSIMKSKMREKQRVESSLKESEQYLWMASPPWVIIIFLISIYEFCPSFIGY